MQPLRDISYPLPKPNYFGHPITDLVLFVHNLNILENINLMAHKYALRFFINEAKQKSVIEIPIQSKNHFYNEAYKIPLHPLPEHPERDQTRAVLIQIIRKGAETIELSGKLNYGHYHKDRAYKISIVLHANNKHNKG